MLGPGNIIKAFDSEIRRPHCRLLNDDTLKLFYMLFTIRGQAYLATYVTADVIIRAIVKPSNAS